ncbi:hypothetical protein JXA47_02025 [Candidatus Sumerlaeota bacterium]|nr:hypothetical protein [Candidatus Sumerlaeota bacterium]
MKTGLRVIPVALVLVILASCGGGGIGGNAPSNIKDSFQGQLDQMVEMMEQFAAMAGGSVEVQSATVNIDPSGSGYIAEATLHITGGGESATETQRFRYNEAMQAWIPEM